MWYISNIHITDSKKGSDDYSFYESSKYLLPVLQNTVDLVDYRYDVKRQTTLQSLIYENIHGVALIEEKFYVFYVFSYTDWLLSQCLKYRDIVDFREGEIYANKSVPPVIYEQSVIWDFWESRYYYKKSDLESLSIYTFILRALKGIEGFVYMSDNCVFVPYNKTGRHYYMFEIVDKGLLTKLVIGRQ